MESYAALLLPVCLVAGAVVVAIRRHPNHKSPSDDYMMELASRGYLVSRRGDSLWVRRKDPYPDPAD